MRWPLISQGSAAFFPPHPRLLGCVRGYLVRDTTGGPPLPAAARHNHYPASGHASLVWLLAGSSTWVAPAERAGQALPPTLLLGPQRRPWQTFNPGPVRSFGIVFAPEALHRLTGLDMAALVDQALPVDGCLDARWLAWCEAVRAAPDDRSRIRQVEAHLHEAWHLAPAPAGGGRSPRSLARRLKTWLGLSPREAQGLDRLEHTLLAARRQDLDRAAAWADAAALGGYSDQAHLCRHTRRATGCSPGELARRSGTDEGFWLYRLWGGEAPAGADASAATSRMRVISEGAPSRSGGPQ